MSDTTLVGRVQSIKDALQENTNAIDDILIDDDFWLASSQKSLLVSTCSHLGAALECLNSILILDAALTQRYLKETHAAVQGSQPPQPSKDRNND